MKVYFDIMLKTSINKLSKSPIVSMKNYHIRFYYFQNQGRICVWKFHVLFIRVLNYGEPYPTIISSQ